jgi:hypothetical protein
MQLAAVLELGDSAWARDGQDRLELRRERRERRVVVLLNGG